ncbi:MAG: DUF4124 domain-containing protein [Moraxellaceae bacterium]
MMRETVVPLVVIALVAGAGWYYREPLTQQFNKSRSSLGASADKSGALSGPESESAPVASHQTPHKDTVYRWVDEKGVTHYDQQAGAGRETVEIDQSRIQSLNSYSSATGATATVPASARSSAANREKSEAKRRGMSPIESLPQAQAAPL